MFSNIRKHILFKRRNSLEIVEKGFITAKLIPFHFWNDFCEQTPLKLILVNSKSKIPSYSAGDWNLSPTHQDHVPGGDIHVGLRWLLTPGGGAAVRARAGLGGITELWGDAADPGGVCAPRLLSAKRCLRCHVLTTQLLTEGNTNTQQSAQISIYST